MYYMYVLFPLTLVTSKSSMRSVGGRLAHSDEFPFVVKLDVQTGSEIITFCSGSALTKSWVLTATHCFVDFIMNACFTKNKCVARYNICRPNKNGDISTLTSVKVHDHNAIERDHDIALVKTETMKVHGLAKLSSLDYTSLIGQRAFGVGYGITNITGLPLQVVEVMLVRCEHINRERESIELFYSLCMVTLCDLDAIMTKGDSGGPIVHESGVVGIVSRGYSRYKLGRKYLSMRARASASAMNVVSSYIDWISDVIQEKS